MEFKDMFPRIHSGIPVQVNKYLKPDAIFLCNFQPDGMPSGVKQKLHFDFEDINKCIIPKPEPQPFIVVGDFHNFRFIMWQANVGLQLSKIKEEMNARIDELEFESECELLRMRYSKKIELAIEEINNELGD